jgi:hypothetical protein
LQLKHPWWKTPPLAAIFSASYTSCQCYKTFLFFATD